MNKKSGFGSIKLSRRHERWVYAVGGLLLLSGVGWLIAHYFLSAASEFGDPHHGSEPWWLRLHGAAAMGFLVIFGALLPAHIVAAWRSKKNRRSGGLMIAVVALLGLTAYGLYYASSDTLRSWLSAIHWITGILATGVLVWHVLIGKHLRTHRRVQSKQVKKQTPVQMDSNPPTTE